MSWTKRFQLQLLLTAFYLLLNVSDASLLLPSGPSPSPLPSSYFLPQGIKAAYWPSFNGFPASSIDTSYFTHIYYAFVLPNPITYELDIVPFHKEKIPEFIHALSSTTVKTMLSIGGGGDNATVFSNMVSNVSTRAIFINSSIEIAREYGFDGIDLDWEFPQNESDMMNIGLLYKEWYNALAKDAIIRKIPRLLLTSAVYFAAKISNFNGSINYPTENMNKYVDWISPMCFDYYGSWNNVTGEHTSLYDPNSNLSTSFGVHSWMDSGMQPEKIVMGLALYGHTWTLQDPNVNGIGAPTSSVVGPGNGILSYSQVMDFNWANNAIVKFDIESSSFYSYAGVTWIGYDDISSVRLKVQFAKANDLAGYFVWAIGDDQDWALSKQAYETWGS